MEGRGGGAWSGWDGGPIDNVVCGEEERCLGAVHLNLDGEPPPPSTHHPTPPLPFLWPPIHAPAHCVQAGRRAQWTCGPVPPTQQACPGLPKRPPSCSTTSISCPTPHPPHPPPPTRPRCRPRRQRSGRAGLQCPRPPKRRAPYRPAPAASGGWQSARAAAECQEEYNIK